MKRAAAAPQRPAREYCFPNLQYLSPDAVRRLAQLRSFGEAKKHGSEEETRLTLLIHHTAQPPEIRRWAVRSVDDLAS